MRWPAGGPKGDRLGRWFVGQGSRGGLEFDRVSAWRLAVFSLRRRLRVAEKPCSPPRPSAPPPTPALALKFGGEKRANSLGLQYSLRNSVFASFVFDENRKDAMIRIQSVPRRTSSSQSRRLSSGGRAVTELRRRCISATLRSRNDFALVIQSLLLATFVGT